MAGRGDVSAIFAGNEGSGGNAWASRLERSLDENISFFVCA
jgi:hypothetical protein